MSVGTGLKSTLASLLPAVGPVCLLVLTSLSALAKARVQSFFVQVTHEQLEFVLLHASELCGCTLKMLSVN